MIKKNVKAGLSTLSKVEGYFDKVGGKRRAKLGKKKLGWGPPRTPKAVG